MKTLLIGLAAGVAIGYFLATDDKEALIEDAKGAFNKGKDFVKDTLQKGKAKMAAAHNEVEDEVHGM